MTKRILIADDEQPVRQLLELVLSSQGYEVLIAQNGDQAGGPAPARPDSPRVWDLAGILPS